MIDEINSANPYLLDDVSPKNCADKNNTRMKEKATTVTRAP
jgi:hypothetical protein